MPTIKVIHPNWNAPPVIRAFTTLRSGGVSQGPYKSLNLASHVGDEWENVRKNRQRLVKAEFLPTEPTWLTQVHGRKIIDAGRSLQTLQEADGAYTNSAQVVCGVMTADCLPILICDRQGAQVAALHAGWRGLLAGIIQEGVKMFKTRGEDLVVWLGPAIGPAAFEVGGEVRSAFCEQNSLHGDAFEAIPGTEKFLANIYLLARHIFRHVNVPDYNIFGGEYCTYTQKDMFYSYRRDGVTGRMVTLIFRTA